MNKNIQNNQKKPQLCFLKANIAGRESLKLYRDLLSYFGYEKKFDKKYYFSMSNGKTEFLIYHGSHIDPKGIYIGSTGISGFYLEAKNRSAVDKFNKNFLRVHNIKPISNFISPKKKWREIYFFNKENTGFGLYHNPGNKNKEIIESDIKRLGIRLLNEDSFVFHKNLLLFLGYKLIGECRDKEYNNHSAFVGDDNLWFELWTKDLDTKNNEGSGIYCIDAGLSAFFIEVKDKKEVDRVVNKFLKPNKINYRFNDASRIEEGDYSVFFTTPERMTIGIVSSEAKLMA